MTTRYPASYYALLIGVCIFLAVVLTRAGAPLWACGLIPGIAAAAINLGWQAGVFVLKKEVESYEDDEEDQTRKEP